MSNWWKKQLFRVCLACICLAAIGAFVTVTRIGLGIEAPSEP